MTLHCILLAVLALAAPPVAAAQQAPAPAPAPSVPAAAVEHASLPTPIPERTHLVALPAAAMEKLPRAALERAPSVSRHVWAGALAGGVAGTLFGLWVISVADCGGPGCTGERVVGVAGMRSAGRPWEH